MKKYHILLAIIYSFLFVQCSDDGRTDFAIQPEEDKPRVDNPILKIQAQDGADWIDGVINGKIVTFSFRFIEENNWDKVPVRFEIDENTSMISPESSSSVLNLSKECAVQVTNGYLPVDYTIKATKYEFLKSIKVTIDSEVNTGTPIDRKIDLNFINSNVASAKVEVTLNDGIIMESPSETTFTRDLSSPLEIKIKDTKTNKIISYMLSIKSDWANITSTINSNGTSLPSYMSVFENKNLHGRDGNTGYVVKIESGSVNMLTSYNEKAVSTWFENNQRVSDVVNQNQDYKVFVGGVSTEYWKPLTRPTVINTGSVVKEGNFFWNIAYYTSPPTIGVKNGKASIEYADVVNSSLYKFETRQSGSNKSSFTGGTLWDVEAAISGYSMPLKGGIVQITNESSSEYKSLADKERNFVFSTVNGMEMTSVQVNIDGTDQKAKAYISDRQRMARTMIGVTSDGGLMIFVSERYTKANNTLIDTTNYPSDGSTLQEAATALKELGCSEALALHQVTYAVTVLQNGASGKDLTKTYERSDGRDLKNSTLTMFK